MRKVIVIGLDGLEPSIVEPLLRAGALPNLAAIQARGGMARIRSTTPAQTPVAWSTFATGTNPGGHGIFDFIRRDPVTYLPDLGLSRYEQKNAFVPPAAVNLRGGRTVWEVLADAGVPSVVLRCPCTYPPGDVKGRLLAGMGVPDVRGGLGTSTYYTTDGDDVPGESEMVVHVERASVVNTHLVGPRHPRSGEDTRLDIRVETDPAGDAVTIHSPGEPRTLTVARGEWSDWLKVKFKMGLLQSIHGMVRFHLRSVDPLELYASPVNFDPRTPAFPVSAPWDYAGELERAIGTYYTTGMVEDHTGLNNGRFDEDAYLAQCEQVMQERERMMLYELDRFERGLFFCLFDTPDRLQHMFWRYRDADHPAATPGDYAHVIEDHYRRCDEAVGRALTYADDDTLFVVLSDHGFGSFRRGVHLNSWLHENGFLALAKGVESGEEAGDFLRHVDWSNTRAYALGLGSIYLNVKGRESNGIVPADGAADVADAIARGLRELRDPQDGHAAVRDVFARDRVYRGTYVDAAPDLVVGFAAGYRVSWGTALGGVPRGLVEDNVKRWSGDHIVDPALVPGVLFMNRPFAGARASLEDMAPTILAALGVPPAPAMEGSSLLT